MCMGLVCVCEEELAVGNKAVTVGWFFCFLLLGYFFFYIHKFNVKNPLKIFLLVFLILFCSV